MEQINVQHPPERYENIFNMYQFNTSNNDTYVFYNILTKIGFPSDLDPSIFDYYRVDGQVALTVLSYRLYGNQHLWWLIMALNNLKNPVKLIESGSILKVVKKEYLDLIFNSIKNKM